MTADQDENQSSNVKKEKQKEEERITQYSDGKDVYHIGDIVYIESQRPDLPYYICSIKDFKRGKKDGITVDVIWFYRPYEIPVTVYQLLLQDRNAENGSGENNILENPVVKERELFVSDAVDIFPATLLRGHANCNPFNDIKEHIIDYISHRDNWYYILRYNADTKRMANAKGEIRIGVSHQATLPICIPYNERSKEDLKKLHHTCKEDLMWDPEAISDAKLIMYLRAARSVTSFNSFWEGDHEGKLCIIDKSLNMISEDMPNAHTYDILHRSNYEVTSALEDLFICPKPKKMVQPWSEDERKKFMRGLRSYGKTFHKIRKELLPDRATAELIQYYYFWKKTSIACSSRPHKRGGRRHNVLARKTRTTKPKPIETSEFVELSSCSENEYDYSEDSENCRDLSLYACRHCYATKSINWHHAGKRKVLLCHDCRIYFKTYGQMRPLKEEEKREPPPYIYKAAFENLEEQAPYTGRMRTRRSSTPVFCNAVSVRNRILQDAKTNRSKQTTPLPTTQEQACESENKVGKTKRKAVDDESNGSSSNETKKTRLDRREFDDARDADDESEESESSRNSDKPLPNEDARPSSPIISSSSISSTPVTSTITTMTKTIKTEPEPSIQQSVISGKSSLEESNEQEMIKENTFVPIKEEMEEIQPRHYHPVHSQPSILHAHMQHPTQQMIQSELFSSGPPSPEVQEDLDKLEKINSRFNLNRTDPHSTCSRCERIYTFQRPKKQKLPDMEKRLDDQPLLRREKDALRRRESGSPTINHQPAQITSHHFDSRQRLFQQQQHRVANMLPYGLPHERAHRPQSPRDMRDPREMHNLREFYDPKYHHPLKAFERPPTEHRTTQALMSPHPAHPFTPRASESMPIDFHRLSQSRSHMPAHIPNTVEARARGHHPSVECNPGERIPVIDRPMIEPPSSGSLIQPQLHAHHHTHTHLHLHDDVKYRNPAVSEAGHFDRHEHVPQHPGVPPPNPIAPHRPNSRPSRELYDLQHKGYTPEALAQARLREMNRFHTPINREAPTHQPPTVVREGTVSPSFPHEAQEMIRDPVDYHLYLTRPRKIYPPHSTRHGHAQAPDLSPRGLPQPPRHGTDFNREACVDKHLTEKLSLGNPHHDHEKYLRAEHARLYDEKQMRHHMLMQERSATDPLKMKTDLLSERYPREELPSPYHYDFRRLEMMNHEARSLYERGMHPDAALYAAHERERRIAQLERPSTLGDRALAAERLLSERAMNDRSLNERVLSERALHERYLRQNAERIAHARSPLERPVSAHERASIFFKPPETIDLSED